mmetsp:Transcript_4071/g.11152  ORF Transcript_4071/g.11152 Transcript_4071/m.11152 type:complete len:253 (+) Transcript_4071:53-811(+)
MASARDFARPEDGDDPLLLADAVDEAGWPLAHSEAAPRRVRGRGLKVLLAAVLGVVGFVAAVRSLGHVAAAGADAEQSVALSDQHTCFNCLGGSCQCGWANAKSCSAKAFSTDCCWSCCCSRGGLQVLPQGMLGSSEPLDPGCPVSHGQVVHVTGSSGTDYHGMVSGYQGNGVYEVSIGQQTYPVQKDSISECAANALLTVLTFWLPLLLVLAALCVAAYMLYKKWKDGKLPWVPEALSAPAPAKRGCCGGC